MDDPRVELDGWFYPVSMDLEETGLLEGGDWTVIPYTRAYGRNAQTVDGQALRMVLE